jgi:hypothetical protein
MRGLKWLAPPSNILPFAFCIFEIFAMVTFEQPATHAKSSGVGATRNGGSMTWTGRLRMGGFGLGAVGKLPFRSLERK